jgi:VanZ family protein
MIKWLEKHRILSLIITILIIIEIFYFSSLSFGKSTEGNPCIPTLYHFTIFFLLNFFLLITINKNKKIKDLIIVPIISIIYALLDEFHQVFVPSRTFSIQDILIDTAGILLSAIIYLTYNKNIKK